jgi:hypothetical protein
MNLYGFIASLIHSVAWPVAALATVILLRKNIAPIFDRLLEARFGKYLTLKLQSATSLLRDARRELSRPELNVEPATERQIEPPNKAIPHISLREQLSPLPLSVAVSRSGFFPAGTEQILDPALRVKSSWNDLTTQIVSTARAMGLKGVRSPRKAVAYLVETSLVSQQFQESFENVELVYGSVLRQQSAIDHTLAREFTNACTELGQYLMQISPHAS